MLPRVFKSRTVKLVKELTTKKSTLYADIHCNLFVIQLYNRPVGKGGKLLLDIRLIPYTYYYK